MMPASQPGNLVHDARSAAEGYEAKLEASRRKRLGQFFTGLPLSRLLTAIALGGEAAAVIDPMAGDGDLLDAVIERAASRSQPITRLDAVEIDQRTARLCRRRLEAWSESGGAEAVAVRAADAFDPQAARQYANDGYDLVITNPPYVRYQTQASADSKDELRAPEEIRRCLYEIAKGRVGKSEWDVWERLIRSYSGLADLSVPAWILAGALVRPGGVLALVAPTTWRSRDYGDVIAYLMARCFRIEYLIEDTQPGWFSDALVRTQLVVARRYTSSEVHVPLMKRGPAGHAVVSVRVSPHASGRDSLVGAAFPGDDPEGSFGEWLRNLAGTEGEHGGIAWNRISLDELSEEVAGLARRRKWGRALEPDAASGPLFRSSERSHAGLVPGEMKRLLKDTPFRLVLPSEAGIAVGQGLRTGCNGFFYVDLLEVRPGDRVRVRLSALFDEQEIMIPGVCVAPVVRRQSEVEGPVRANRLPGRALDLSRWILPEDADSVERIEHLYAREGTSAPSVMPPDLADFVRRAASTKYESGSDSRRIPELSAVKTNARESRAGRTPRFWYMLPPFARRHRPDAFVPRVCQGAPEVEINDDPPVLIDANFSTIWAESHNWTRHAIRALFNSAWCRACMEALGTPLGGGALKLEATQIRRVPLPSLGARDLEFLDVEGRTGSHHSVSDSIDLLVLERITGWNRKSPKTLELRNGLKRLVDSLCGGRQRRTT